MVMVGHKRESENFHDAYSLPYNPMRPGLIGLKEWLFEMKECGWCFVVELIEVVDKTEIVGMAEEYIAFFHTKIANVVDLIFCEVYFSSRHNHHSMRPGLIESSLTIR